MPASNPSLGFLSVLPMAELGFCGGFLILNQFGRPIEFHCTLPIRADRAQEILYGPTLKTYLFSEHIGPAMTEKAKSKPAIVFVDARESLELRAHIEPPVALVAPRPQADADGRCASDHCLELTADLEDIQTEAPIHQHHFHRLAGEDDRQFRCIDVGSYSLSFLPKSASDAGQIEQIVADLPGELRLTEPFERIHEAIREAHAVAR